jgi:hypothetical protein
MPTVGELLAGQQPRAETRHLIATVSSLSPPTVTLPGGATTPVMVPIGMTPTVNESVLVLLAPAANIVLARLQF